MVDVSTYPLYVIFNKCLTQGIFPDKMKIADVFPLHKSRNIHMVDNYRPISLLMTISKILEKLVYNHVYTFLNNTNQIYDSQYGFRSKHSCEHAISELVGNILKGKENGEHTISVFLDLSKAFDTLEYSTLFKKLEIYGIHATALDWFKSYLTNREMQTKCIINDQVRYSDKKNITYGAPQGSCLGPLIFLIFCNDLHLNLEFTKCILFADDTTIYCKNKNVQLLIASIEHDLEIINDWFKANKLMLNKKKSLSIFFSSKTNEKLQIPPSLKLENSNINFVDHTKFLGVWIDKNLTWTAHTNRVIQKIQRNAHMLFRSKNLLSAHAKKILYYAQIYSHISCELSIWGPMINNKTIKKIQNVQKNCLNCFTTTAVKNPLQLSDVIKQEVLKFGWKITHQELPVPLQKCAITTAKGQTLEKKT